MGHGNGIKWYQHIELPGSGIGAATAALAVEPARPPGTSCEFFAAANRLAQRAQALRDVLAKLGAIASSDGGWTGEAADSFRTLLRDAHRSHYDQVPVRYEGFARALRQYGAALDGHQAAIDRARADVQAALDAYQRTQSFGPSANPGADPWPYPQLSLRPDRPDLDDCLAAARRFQAAYNDWVDAVTACEHAIEHVDDDKLHNAHGVHVAVDVIGSVTGLLADVTAVLAVLTLPWPPVAALFLAVSTGLSMIHLGTDITRKVVWNERVSATDFAIDALGSIPVVGSAGEGVKAARAVRTAGRLGKAEAGAKAAFGEFLKPLKEFRPELAKLRQNGIWQTLRHPDLPEAGRTFVRDWGHLQDAASVGLQAYNDRKQGVRPALENAAFSVVLGPLSPVGVSVLDTAGRAVMKTADQAAHGAR